MQNIEEIKKEALEGLSHMSRDNISFEEKKIFIQSIMAKLREHLASPEHLKTILSFNT
jgi:hypothetical protein